MNELSEVEPVYCGWCGKAWVRTYEMMDFLYEKYGWKSGFSEYDCPTCLGEVPRQSYADYLKSDHWQYVRQIKLKQADYKCQLCSKTNSLHVHHNTYERIGQELLSDLTVLCAHCHAKFHDKLEVQS